MADWFRTKTGSIKILSLISLFRNLLWGDSGHSMDCLPLWTKMSILWLIVVWEELILGIKCKILDVILWIGTEFAIAIVLEIDVLIRKEILSVEWSLLHGLTRFFLFINYGMVDFKNCLKTTQNLQVFGFLWKK